MNTQRRPEAEEGTPSGTQNHYLDQLIEEGKEEKRKILKDKLQQKLKIIRDRRISGVSNDPFPEGAFDRLKSNNMWEEILSYLTETCDVKDACFTCQTFPEILNERRMMMTLPEVLNVFKTKVDEAYAFGEDSEKAGSTCYQNWKTLCLNARRVCKTWKKTVDLHSDIAWEDWVRPGPKDSQLEVTTLSNPRSNLFTFEDEESVDKATSSLISQGFTVSPIRDLFVCVGEHMPEPYYRKLMEYFKAYGSSVRFLCYHFESAGDTPAGAHRMLCDMLKYTPNLKGLDIEFEDNLGDELQDSGEAFQFQDIQHGHSTLPPLTSLKYLCCCLCEPNESLVARILGKCDNLRSLKFYHCCGGPTQSETTETLAALSLERFEGFSTIIARNHFNWPLKHLKIRTRTLGMGMELNASVFLPAINRFRDTLEHLEIFDAMRIDADAGNIGLKLELPHLKFVFIRLIRCGTLGLDDLLPLKSLQEITVEFVEFENENALVKVKAYKEIGEVQKSNVWQLFPNLQRFKSHPISGPTYFRPTST